MNRRIAKILTLSLAIAIAIALAAAIWARLGSSIAIGPYVQNVSENSATICWATVDGEITWTTAGEDAQTIRAYNHHSITLRRLQPGTTYNYKVPGVAGKGFFTTCPEGEHPFVFVVFGDTRPPGGPGAALRRHAVHRRIVERIMAEKPHFVFNTGDLVKDGRWMPDWEAFFKISGDLMRTVPYYPVLGNHEKNARSYFDFFSLPGNERYYSFNRGTGHFVVLDNYGLRMAETNQAITERQQKRLAQQQQDYFRRQIAWLKEDLAGHQDFKYIFVFFHIPLYTVMESRAEKIKAKREMFGSIFQDYSVSAVFSGHDHHYHRAVAGGIPFVTTAGGGAPLYDIDAPQPETVKYAKIEHYVRVDVRGDRAAARVIDINGETIDEFEISPRSPTSSEGAEE